MPRNVRHILITIGILLIFTAVFDSFIVSLGIVAYDHTKLLGLSIGSAPIEDFFYAILAGFMIPLLWKLTGRYDKKR
jgi:lycopene cyclase domain-containing protein